MTERFELQQATATARFIEMVGNRDEALSEARKTILHMERQLLDIEMRVMAWTYASYIGNPQKCADEIRAILNQGIK